MTLSPVLAVQAPLCDATGLETPGLVEVHEEGILLTSHDLGSIGMSWSTFLDLVDNPRVQQMLEEAREDGA